jgi:hypothetical protein
MANHANYNGAFGFSAEAQARQAAKYDKALEGALRTWVEEKTEMPIGDDFADGLKNGVILCKLINKLKPKTIKGINLKAKMPFHCMENITKFLNGCRALGIPEHSMFSTVDLYEAKNMTAVLLTLDNLMREVTGRTEPVERSAMTRCASSTPPERVYSCLFAALARGSSVVSRYVFPALQQSLQ